MILQNFSYLILAQVVPPIASSQSIAQKTSLLHQLISSMIINTNWNYVFGMLLMALTIIYYLKEVWGPYKIKDELLRNSAYIKDLKENSDKAATLVKETAEKVEFRLRETADRVEVRLKESSDKVEIKLKESSEKAETLVKNNAERVSSVTNSAIESLQRKMEEFQIKFDSLNREIEKLKELVNEKEETVIESEKKIQEIRESQKKLAIYVDELLRQMIDML